MTGTRRWGSAVLALALGGCASTGWHTEAGRHIDRTLATAQHQQEPAPPSAVRSALVPGIQIHLPALAPMANGARFNLAVNNAPARSVFLGLVAGTAYSVTVPPGISGNITLNLHQVTVPEAMRAIRRTYHYEYDRRGHQYYLLPPGLQTRIFRVNYLNVVRTGSSDTRMASGDLTSAPTASMGGVPGSVPPQGASTGTASLSNIQVETTSKSDFWKQLQQTVSALVGTQNGNMVVANAQASLLIVRASPRQMRVVARLLRIMQVNVDREVVLSAKILEVQLNSGFQSGINWADLAQLNGASITSEQLGGGSLLSSGSSEIAGSPESMTPSIGVYAPIAPTSAFGGMLTLAVQARNFASFIELLKTQGRVQVLSSPQVATVNNQKAVIKVGGDDFFVTGITNSVSNVGLTAVTVPSVQLTPFFSGIALDVTPQIDNHGNVILAIHPSVSQVTQRNQTFSVSSQTYSLPLASSSIQESDDIVRAHSGQIIVIGGLMKDGTTTENASVPLLGDLPGIGVLFQHRKIVRVKSELVILLKATVVTGGRVWSREVDSSERRIRAIRGAP